MRGTVKWFDSQKGYGFISKDDRTGDVFVHFSQIDGTGYKNLTEGDHVDFDVERTDRGERAVRVRKS